MAVKRGFIEAQVVVESRGVQGAPRWWCQAEFGEGCWRWLWRSKHRRTNVIKGNTRRITHVTSAEGPES